MEYKDMLHQELIFLDISASDRTDLFHQIAIELKNKGYVKDTYEKALNKREDEFPTGIVFPLINVMLPHADPENVNEAFLAIVKVTHPVSVLQMGYNTEEQADAMFFLGITDSSQQVGLLQEFTDLLQDEDFVNEFKQINNPAEMYKLVASRI